MGNNRGGPYQLVKMQDGATDVGDGTAIECAIGEDGAYSFLRVQVTGITTATITFEGTIDGTNYTAIQATNMATGAVATTATADGTYGMSVAGLLNARARISAHTTGTIYATGIATAREPAALSYQDVDVTSIAAGENVIGLVGASDIVVTVTPTCDTGAYGSGDLIFDSTAVANAVRVAAGIAILQSVTIIDKDDQGVAFTLLIANAATDFGTLNSAPDPDDTEAATVIGFVPVATTDYIDLGGAKVACIRNIGLVCKAAAASTSLYVAAMNGSGTPTYSASGLVLQLGFLRS